MSQIYQNFPYKFVIFVSIPEQTKLDIRSFDLPAPPAKEEDRKPFPFSKITHFPTTSIDQVFEYTNKLNSQETVNDFDDDADAEKQMTSDEEVNYIWYPGLIYADIGFWTDYTGTFAILYAVGDAVDVFETIVHGLQEGNSPKVVSKPSGSSKDATGDLI